MKSNHEMLDVELVPKIETIFNANQSPTSQAFYDELIRDTLQNAFKLEQYEQLLEGEPLIASSWCQSVPGDICFFALSKHRPNSFKFFYDMISNWLYPSRHLNVTLVYAVDFRLPEITDQIFTLSEVMIRIETMHELEHIQKNYPVIESELRLGIPSSYYARRILESKGLLTDEKATAIQDYIAHLLERHPIHFDNDLINEMQHVLVTCNEKYKLSRESRHLSRIIAIQYLYRKNLHQAILTSPRKRFLYLKLFRTRIKTKHGEKPVLGVLVGINFLQDKEIFETKHLLKAIQNYIPEAQVIDDSLISSRRSSHNVFTLYLEIEKNSDLEFTPEEIRLLRQELPSDLKDRIEHLMHPVFMPHNEEEIIRNILSLSNQIKYLRDIPQVFISFDEQTPSLLVFTIILVRVLKPGAPSIQEMFNNTETFLEYTHDRCQYSGTVRRKFKKRRDCI